MNHLAPAASRAAIHTLGCRLNQADSALIADDLNRAGFTICGWDEPADLYVINSCTVTAAAAQKTRQAARAVRRRQPRAFIVLAGCEAELTAADTLWQGVVDLIVPNADKTRLSRLLPEYLCGGSAAPPEAATGATPTTPDSFTEPGCGLYPARTRANLKIQEGCDFFCSYCIVPHVRGRPRSRVWEDVLREARELVDRGHQEIVLTGVNIACYQDRGRTLTDLLAGLLDATDGVRFRLSSTEPGAELPGLIELMSQSPRICRFLHLPLQYGEDTILKAMNRRYTVDAYRRWAALGADAVPGLCLGSDIIVGFPGETDEHFEVCAETLVGLPLSYLHVFRYSPRPGTPAASLPDPVDGRIAAARRQRLAAIGKCKAEAFAHSQVGKVLAVLTEQRNRKGQMEGWSDNYLRVAIEDAPELPVNQLVQARVTSPRGGRGVLASIRTLSRTIIQKLGSSAESVGRLSG